MATVEFGNADEDLMLWQFPTVYSGGSNYVRASNVFSWDGASNDNHIAFSGTGFTFNGGVPTAGVVTGFTLDVGGDSGNAPGLEISGLSFNLSSLAPLVNGGLSNDQQNDLIWRTLLSGNDTINFDSDATDSGQVFSFAGDGSAVGVGLDLQGGDDVIKGDLGPGGDGRNSNVSGDFDQVSGTLNGGDDTITVFGTGAEAVGDCYHVYGTVNGGDDRMSVHDGGSAYGDAVFAYDGAEVIGGNDVIGGNLVYASGDVFQVLGGTVAGGDDFIKGSWTGPLPGGNTLYGDAQSLNAGGLIGGDDTIYGQGLDDHIYGDTDQAANGTLTAGADQLFGGDGNDTIYGDWGTKGNDVTIVGGNDTLSGGGGDDILIGNGGYDRMSGGAGDDTIFGASDDDPAAALDPDSSRDDDVIDGGDGADTVTYETALTGVRVDLELSGSQDTGGGHDKITNVENVTGSNFDDTLSGDEGDNTINCLDGTDTVYGRGGDDTLVFGAGTKELYGGDGNDTFVWTVHDGAVTIRGESGNDMIELDGNAPFSFSSFNAPGLMSVERFVGNGFVISGTDGDNVLNFYGMAMSNTPDILGLDGNDTITGGKSGDTIFGDAGSDSLQGSSGNDWLKGGADKDYLSGGAGRDVFYYDQATDSDSNGMDTIADFRHNADKVDLMAMDANSRAGGNQSFRIVDHDAFSGRAGELRLQSVRGGTIVEGDLDGDRHADLEIFFHGNGRLTGDDFLL